MTALARIDELIGWLVPSNRDISQKELISKFLELSLGKCLGARIFVVGSSATNTCLQNEVLDINLYLCKGQEEKWFSRANESFFSRSSPSSTNLNLKKVSFLPLDNRLELVINEMIVNISPNNLSSLYFTALQEEFNTLIGSDNLFKKSLLLIKAWLQYDAPRYIKGFSCFSAMIVLTFNAGR